MWIDGFQIVVPEKTLESPLDCKEIKLVNPKGNQPWIFTGRTDTEVEAPILQPPDAKSWLIDKDPDSGKDWRQGEKGMKEDEMVGWHHQLNGHGFEQTLGDHSRQRSLACCMQSMGSQSRTQLSDWTTTTERCKDFPDGPEAKTLHSRCRMPGFSPWSGD